MGAGEVEGAGEGDGVDVGEEAVKGDAGDPAHSQLDCA